MFYQIFLSPQVKQCMNIIYNQDMLKLFQLLLNNATLIIPPPD